jgi:hypothetical protein
MWNKGVFIFLLAIVLNASASFSASILLPMDESQKNHLKAYGLAFWILKQDQSLEWLLNYRGGSFLLPNSNIIEQECRIRGISYEVLADVQVAALMRKISEAESNMDAIKLEKAPRIAVYSPKNKLPWDDAVTMVLTYAEIPYDLVYDDEVIQGLLPKYDWLHLHHEDFTGQYGRFWAAFRNAPWYLNDVRIQQESAERLGFKKVSQLKLAVAQNIRDFTAGGGFLFAMCSGTDSYDIALAAAGVDICESMFDGDAADRNAQKKLNYENGFAFQNFKLSMNPNDYEFSDIDNTQTRNLAEENDYFSLFEFSAKWDPVPSMLTQNHEQFIKGFMGQTTAFKKSLIKPDVLIMGETKSVNEARYIHGEFGKGTWTFYGGHDPEDYQHLVNDPPTDLNLHPNSPGYRLILNNVLFPAAKKKKQKT